MSVRILAGLNLVSSATDPVSATVGDLYFNTTSNTVKVYNGTAWTTIAGGGGSITVSATAPTTPAPTTGALWFDSNTGQLFIYYSSYWLEVGAGGSGAASSIITAVDGGTYDSIASYNGGDPTTASWANTFNGGTP
jgi:hypothetical protein